MIPKRPFLLRAFYDWIAENNMTPHILVNTAAEEVTVPKQHIKDGKIVLNISPMAVQDFIMDNEALSFSARFGGVAFYIYCPMYAIEAIYARESPADGISFSPDEYADVVAVSDEGEDVAEKPAAAVVLSAVDNSSKVEAVEEASELVAAEQDKAERNGSDATGTDDDNNDETTPPRKRPALRVVK